MNAFDKVIGYETIKNELLQICDMIHNREVYEELGAKLPSSLVRSGRFDRKIEVQCPTAKDADEIIKQHQGLLFVESTEGVGTTVTIVLPLYEPEESDISNEETVTLEEILEVNEEEQGEENG